jgi:glycosyltransferase involved in cell wall biosynthesis
VIVVVHHVHDEQFGTHFPRPVAALGRWLEGPVSRRVYRRSPAVAVSASTIAALRTRLRWRGPIVLVPNGVRQPPDSGGLLPSRSVRPRVVAVGRLVRHKRLDHVVRLADQLGTAWPGLDVHIVGRGPDESRIRSVVTRLEDPSRVTLHGFLPTSEKDALLRTAWLHLSASQGEGWGLSVLEAAALGVPTVAYDVDGLRDAIQDGETGWLVADGETLPDAVSRALGEVAADAERAAQLSKVCIGWAESFDWESSVARMAQLIRAELDRVSGPRRSWRSRPRAARERGRPSAATKGGSGGRPTAAGRRR